MRGKRMIFVKSIHIENYKCFEKFDMDFQYGTNIIVGNNEAGKSTILEAMNLCLSGLLNGRYLRNELSEYLFNKSVVKKYLDSLKTENKIEPPQILIEVYLDSDEDSTPLFQTLKGTGNSRKEDCSGVKIKVLFDEKYETQSEYEELLKTDIKSLPIEYYTVDWSGFHRTSITSRSIPLKPNLIDSSSVKYRNGSDFYIAKIIKDAMENKQKIALMQAYRNLKNDFKETPELKELNKKITNMAKISDKDVVISVNNSDIDAWENILITYFDEIPFTQIGQGEQSIVKTNLALQNLREDIQNLVLIEEPENHLSYSNLNILLRSIQGNNVGKQVVITTHSSYVANKLGLKKLLFLNNSTVKRFDELSDETQNYFSKLPGFNTLRVLLSKKTILVEGPSDELIVQKAYRVKFGCLPIENGIDVISVGLSAPRFLELAKKLNIKVAVVTDNDGNYEENIEKRYEKHIKNDNYFKVFSNKNNDQNTLEPSFVACNIENKDDLKNVIEYKGNKDLAEYMQSNKTEWALKIFDSGESFNFPDYINECIDWINNE